MILFWGSILLAWHSPSNLGQHTSCWLLAGRGRCLRGPLEHCGRPSSAAASSELTGPPAGPRRAWQTAGAASEPPAKFLVSPLEGSDFPPCALLSTLCPPAVSGLLGDPRPSPLCPHNGLRQRFRFSTLETEKLKHEGPAAGPRTCSQGRAQDRPVGGAGGLHGGPRRAEARPGGRASPAPSVSGVGSV